MNPLFWNTNVLLELHFFGDVSQNDVKNMLFDLFERYALQGFSEYTFQHLFEGCF